MRYPGDELNNTGRGRKLLSYAGFPLFFLILFSLFFIYREPLIELFRAPEVIRSWVNEQGIAGPLTFIGIQIVQVIVFIIPGEIPQIAGGYLFGTWLGSLYSLLGITVASAFNFAIGRWLGKPFVRAILGKQQINRFHTFLETPHALLGFFLLFLVPGFPKDALCYIVGLSPLRFISFLIIFVAGRIPAIIASAFMGASAAEENWKLVIILSVLVVAGLVILYTFKSRIFSRIELLTKNRGLSEKENESYECGNDKSSEIK